MLFALIIKKPTNEEDEIVKEIIDTDSPLTRDNRSDQVEIHKVKPPPPKKLLEFERIRRKNLQRVQKFIKDLAFYVLFLGLVFCTIYSMQDSRAFLQSANLKNYFVASKPKLEKVSLFRILSFTRFFFKTVMDGMFTSI